MRGLPKFDDPNLLVGFEGFSDAAVYQVAPGILMVQSLDFFPPLVDDPYLFGQIAAANSMSDVYTMGAHPKTALNIVAFPDNELDLEVLNEILRGAADKVIEADALVVGGHSVRNAEISFGMSVTGFTTKEALLTNKTAKSGDLLVLTKALGTGFVASAFKRNKCPESTYNSSCASMTQLNKVGLEAITAVGGICTSTDITGFGLAGHACEMATSSGVSMEIELDSLPLLPGTSDLFKAGISNRANKSNREYLDGKYREASGVDKMRMEFVFDAQTSGGLLISCPEKNAEKLVKTAKNLGAEHTTIIGRVVDQGDHILTLK